jgi:hypothetical protein
MKTETKSDNDHLDKLTPAETVRAYCVGCLGMNQYNTEAIRDCQCVNCAFYPYRMGKRPSVKVFRQYCLQDCMNGYRGLVSDCATNDCPNHTYRMGKNPALIGKRKAPQAGIDALRKYRQTRRDDLNECQISIFSGQGIGSIVST